MKNRIIATRSGNQITSIINGKSFTVLCETREEAVELFKKILEHKTVGTDEAVETLKGILSPGYKLNASLDGKVQRDRAGNYYLGTDIPLPRKLQEVILEHIEDELPLTPLENFWKLLCLNPDEHVRESLFKFMDRFKMPITDNGYFIAYKSVAWKGEQDKQLGVFVSQQYVNKKSSGRSTKDLLVVEYSENQFALRTEEEYEEEVNELVDTNKELAVLNEAENWLTENKPNEFRMATPTFGSSEEVMDFARNFGWQVPADSYIAEKIITDSQWKVHGFIEELFKNLTTLFHFDTPTFTDWHTKKSTILLGEPVTMPREECDNDPNRTCSSGLHVGAPGYVSRFGYGDENYILACLVNPMNVVAIPHDYNFEKMRTSEYLPYAICEFEDGNIKELDTNYFEEDYINFERKLLKSKLVELDNNEENAQIRSMISDRLVTIG